MANVSHYHYAKITVKSKTDSSDTFTLYVSQRPVLGDSTNYFIPILQSVGRIGHDNGGFIPKEKTGSITLDNRPGSLTSMRRFSDLLDKYTYYDQEIVFYTADVAVGDTDITADAVLFWRDRIDSIDISDTQCTIKLQSQLIPRHIVTYEVSATNHANAPSGSLGKHLPIVFGDNIGVKPYPLETANDTCSFGYASNMGTSFQNAGVTAKYLFDETSKQYRSATIGAFGTGIQNTGTRTASHTIAANNEFFQFISLSANENFPIDAFTLSGRGINAATPDGRLTISLYEGLENNAAAGPGRLLARGQQNASDYSSDWTQATTHSFNVLFILDRVAFLSPDMGVWISIAYDPQSSATAPQFWYTAGSYTTMLRDSGDQFPRNYPGGTASKLYFSSASLSFDDYPDSNGEYSYFDLSHSSYSPATSIDYPELSNIRMLVEMTGLVDDGSGTITGSAGFNIEEPHDAINLLLYTKSGSTYTAGNFDSSFQSGTHSLASSGSYQRTLAGATKGRQTADRLIKDIAEQCVVRVCKTAGSSDDIGVYYWGSTITADDTVSDEHILDGASYNTTGDRRIVNKCVVTYKSTLFQVDANDILAQGGDRGFEGVLSLSHDDGGDGQAISAVSEELFGERELREDRYELISDSTTANTVALYVLSTNDIPHEFFTCRIPYSYISPEVMDVHNIRSVLLPYRGGTALRDRVNDPYDYITDPGRVWRGKTYRGQIYNLMRVLEQGRPAMWEVTYRLLVHPSDPT